MTPLEKIFPMLEMPRSIIGVADSTDVNERIEYMQAMLRHVQAHFIQGVTELNRALPTGTIDAAEFCNALDDAFGDHIGGPLQRIAEQLDEDATEARAPAGSYLRAGE